MGLESFWTLAWNLDSMKLRKLNDMRHKPHIAEDEIWPVALIKHHSVKLSTE